MEKARVGQGFVGVDQIKYVILKRNGKISIIPLHEAREKGVVERASERPYPLDFSWISTVFLNRTVLLMNFSAKPFCRPKTRLPARLFRLS